jgi:hypothetical protein
MVAREDLQHFDRAWRALHEAIRSTLMVIFAKLHALLFAAIHFVVAVVNVTDLDSEEKWRYIMTRISACSKPSMA